MEGIWTASRKLCIDTLDRSQEHLIGKLVDSAYPVVRGDVEDIWAVNDDCGPFSIGLLALEQLSNVPRPFPIFQLLLILMLSRV